jgi:hypothetical protein
MGAKTLAFEQNLIGAARRQGEKKGRLGSDAPPVGADKQRAGARSGHVIALTAANSGSCYVLTARTLRLVKGRRAIINLRRKGFPQWSWISGRRPDRSKKGNFLGCTPLDPEGLEFTAMRNTMTRTTIAGLAALSLMGSLIATAEPAAAGDFHGGGGGWHGGGWHGGGGGWHGGGWHGGGWHGGGWHGGGWHRGGWNGGWAGPAIVGGLAAGALLAAPYAYGNGYGYGGCGTYAPIYDAYGNYLGQQLVNGC